MMDDTFVFMCGRLAADPELKYTGNGLALANFGVAVNEPKKKDSDAPEKCGFYDCTAWGKAAELLCERGHKGDTIILRGTLRQEKWTTKDGQARSRIVVTAHNIETIPKRDRGQAGAGASAKRTEPDGDVPF